jgi:dimethylaniline monooxygenase (N-oxide forming)
MAKKRIAVIGAGAAGLCSAKYLKAAGFEVTIYEIGSQVGGMWTFMNDNGLSNAYRTLHINTSRSVTRFHDLDFDEGVQFFPDHADMHRYLTKYADHFGLTALIRFNAPVQEIMPDFDPKAGEKPKWRVRTEDCEETFDAVVAATGHLSEPRHVPMFSKGFGGEYLHSFSYRAPEDFVGNRVCVIGVGNSACDIASDVCVTSTRTVLVARSTPIILPKLMFGRPFTEITRKIQRPWMPAKLRRKMIAFLAWIAHGDLTKLGFRPPTKEKLHVTSNGTIVNDIAYSRVHLKQDIERIEGQTITFNDGTSDDFDTIIAATGYKVNLPYLADGLIHGDPENNQLDLYKRIVPPDWPGLYMIGFFNTDTALNMIFEHQIRWVRDIELGGARLPTSDAMRADIQAKRDWVTTNFKGTPRHGLEEEHVPYLGELKRSGAEMRKQTAR